ncbi:FAD/NAD(P)-binding domain-containing protein [Jaminaea rosea]|uniref:FAD/NAD(P)-binding domain-containing protein n=1 Tax=Jaminaea rosea TaxID=1569628 RepID=A0A316UQN8_9BASI|nr:FAD/NAD(P)-binding domain-containing protein [Jaminaea rosea]PWN27600.1 FAD/NAD(P)-binding domain-containing protein [Jaminaea rosea]
MSPPRQPRDYHGVENSSTKNVVVLGGSYGGMHAASVLAQKLPPSHRVILIERNSHFNHLYVFPRFSVLQGHEHKAFIPYSSIFGSAPKRRRREDKARGTAPPPQPPASSAPRSGGSVLEMGSGSGDALAPQAEAPSSSSSSLSRGRGSGSSSSDDENRSSRSNSSRGGDSLFDHDTVNSDVTTGSAPSSSGDHSSARDPAHDAGNKAMEQGILEDAQVLAHDEEKMGRPEIRVERLGEDVKEGLTLSEQAPAEDGAASSADGGFEDAEPHVVLQATVTSITDSHVIVTPTSPSSGQGSEGSQSRRNLWSIDSLSIPYTHLIYALGSHLPDPLRTTSASRTKKEGVSWMRHTQEQIRDAQRVVLVGGGALGVEYATDIKSVYPEKDVTLIHSRQRLLPNFDERIHEVAKARLEELGVKLVLGERLALTEGCPKGSTTAPLAEDEVDGDVHPIRQPSDAHHQGWKRVRTTGGRELLCDLLMLCTGQQPNSSLLASLSPTSVDPHTRLIRVHRTLQVALPPPDQAAPGPFDATPPCGDCDCFLDKKAAGGDLDERQEGHLDEHGMEGEERPAEKLGRIPNVYAIGDVADAFGSLNAGYQAWGMADVAAENIIRDIGVRGASVNPEDSAPSSPSTAITPAELVHFSPAPNMLKLSLGLGQMVFQGGPVKGEDGVERPEVSVKDDPADLGVEGVWTFMANMSVEDLYL